MELGQDNCSKVEQAYAAPSLLHPQALSDLKAFFRSDLSSTCRPTAMPIPTWLTHLVERTERSPLSQQHLSAGLQLRLQAIQNNVNHHSLRTLPGSGQSSASLAALRKWLQCTQFKMAQVEIQSSEAASQFYPLWVDSSAPASTLWLSNNGYKNKQFDPSRLGNTGTVHSLSSLV